MDNEIGGVWRTIAGRRVFIKDGQNLSDAMKKSGKFQKKKEITGEDKNIIDDWVQLGNDMEEEKQNRLKEIIKDNGTVNGKVNLIRKVTTPELGTTVEEIKTNPDKLIGRTITAKGFLSTSSKESGADNFVGVTVKINNVKNTKGLDINKIDGLSLYGATRRAAEGEVLFNKGTKYKITKVNLMKDNWGEIYDYTIEADIIE